MTLFELAGKITLDSKGFNTGVKDAEKSGAQLKDKLASSFDKIKAAAGLVVSVTAIKKGIDAVKSFADGVAAAGDRVDKQSQALGMSRKAFQEWDYILGQNGVSIDNLGTSMKTLGEAISKGGGKNVKAFNDLGLNIRKLKKMNPEEQFEATVRAFQKMPAGAKKSQLALQLFGKQGQQLLPLLNSSTTSIDDLKAKAEELGLIMSDDAVNAAVEYGDSLDDLNRTFTGFKNQIGAKLLPVLTQGLKTVTAYAGKLSKAYKENGFKGVIDTLVADIKNIKWPTWDDVKEAALKAWKTIITGVSGLAKIVFGENVDGTIKWPTWEDVKEVATSAWNTIKDGVSKLAKIIFGENVDGTIKFPTWEEIGEAIARGWQGIIDGVKTLGKILFGENVDAEIKFPTWDEIGAAVQEAWKGIVDAVKGLGTGIGKVAFGENVDGTIKWPTWEEIGKAVEDAWKRIVDGVANLGTTIGKAIFGENVDGTIKWPTWDDVKTAVETAWNTIVEGVKSLPTLIFGENSAISTALMSAFEWVKQAIHDVKKFLGIDDGAHLTEQQRFAAESAYNNSTGATGLNETERQGEWEQFTSTLKKNMEDAGFSAEQVQTALDSVTQNRENPQWVSNFLTQLQDSDEAAKALGESVEAASGEHDITFNVSANDPEGLIALWKSGAGDSPNVSLPHNAKGLWDVPYDDYVTRLHRNEMVLSASQARKYREGGSGQNIAGMSKLIVAAIREGMSDASVNAYVNGDGMTNMVNRRTANELKGRRFAPA